MARRASLVLSLSVASILCLGIHAASAFKLLTHDALNARAVTASSVDAYLVSELQLSGVTERFNGLSISRWIQYGGVREDLFLGNEDAGALARSRHHFHNPLEGWHTAGLNALCDIRDGVPPVPVTGLASVRWSQSTDQSDPGADGSATWATARDFYFDGLTSASKQSRETALAATFQVLGQQMHLVGDLAVPAHVRNDVHCAEKAEPFEFWAERQGGRARIPGLRDDEIVKPSTSIFSIDIPDSESVAKIPIARLWDSDQYNSAAPSPSATLRPTIGLAEYTNANFFSRDTIFSTRFPFPARASVDILDVELPVQEPGLFRRYLTKARDGEPVRRSAVASALREFLPPSLKDVKFGLDDGVHSDYADLLFPRAVGYSAALLDYFFRGRLHVDLVPDGAGLKLVGKNGAPAGTNPPDADAMDTGTIAVFADRIDGTREPASAAVLVGRVEPGGDLPVVALTPPADAERFIAVYQGTLGRERGTGQPGNRGAVIGKVLGGYRVEELFSDGTRWNLRTPSGIVPLPILRNQVVDLRWGDSDNTLVGRTAFGNGQPNKLLKYAINRAEGSVNVPLRPAAAGGIEVDVLPPTEALFPIGLDVGGLKLNSTINYRQYLISYLRTRVVDENNVVIESSYSAGDVEVAVTGTASKSFAWRLTLDTDKFNTPSARPYEWQLQQIGLAKDGRMLALIKINITQLDLRLAESFAEFPSKRFVWCGQSSCPQAPEKQDGPAARVPYGFGRGARTIWVLIDVSSGRLIYSSAPSTAAGGVGDVVITNTAETTQFRETTGGPFNGLVATEIFRTSAPGATVYIVDSQNNLRVGAVCGGNPSDLIPIGHVDLNTGVTASEATQFRSDIQPAEFAPYPEHIRSTGPVCLQVNVGASPPVFLDVTRDEARVYMSDAVGAMRAIDGSDRVAMLLALPQGLATNFRGDLHRALTWDPLARTSSARHDFTSGDTRNLTSASHDLALVIPAFSPQMVTVLPLDGPAGATTASGASSLITSFRALNPAFVYSTQAQKFYNYVPSLVQTGLPRTLATGGSPIGDYHTIKMK